VRRPRCAELAESLSAYVDGALADYDREQVLAHLIDCASCRAEVAELRTVRQLLNRIGQTPDGTSAPDDLSSRLVLIAGGDAYQPVWSRPFRRTRTGDLPSARQARRIKTTAAVLALGSLLSALGLVGYLAAPTLEAVAVGDPSERVRTEFASTLTQFPLASRSINALMMTPRTELLTRPTGRNTPRSSSVAELPVPGSTALALLHRAAEESDQVSYSGTQEVQAASDGRTISATVQISSEAGQGSVVSVYNRVGRQVVNGFVPASASSRIADQELLTLLPDHYRISGWVGSTVVGRPVTVVEASTTTGADDPAGTSGDGRVAARWWIDNATGLLLWQETYDTAGNVALAAGFTAVTITDKPVFMEHLAPRLAISTTTASLTLSHTGELASRGWYCQDDVAGLSLIRMTSDAAIDPDALHMVYSDGVSTLSVFEQRGRLSGAPAGSHWDPSLRAHLLAGTPTMATWQSGDRVFTVVTDGPVDLIRTAAQTLPHAELEDPTTMERIHVGWSRILQRAVR
jgi:hypothetical protein